MSKTRKRLSVPAFFLILLLLPVFSSADGTASASDPDMIDPGSISGAGLEYDYNEAAYRSFVYDDGITADVYFPVRRGLIYHGPDAVIKKLNASENIMSEKGSVMYELSCEADELALRRLQMSLEIREADIAHEKELREKTLAGLWDSYRKAAAVSAVEAELASLSIQEFQADCEISDLSTEKELEKLREEIAYQASLQETTAITAPCDCFLVKSYAEIGRKISDGDLICLIAEASRPIMKCVTFTPSSGLSLEFKTRTDEVLAGKCVLCGLDFPYRGDKSASYIAVSSFSSELWAKTMKSKGSMETVPAFVKVDPSMVQRDNILSISLKGLPFRVDTKRKQLYELSVVNEDNAVQRRTVRFAAVFNEEGEDYAWIVSGLFPGDRVVLGLSDYILRPNLHIE